MAVSPEVQAANLIAASNLAAALITASGRPHSVNEAIKLLHDFVWSFSPSTGNSAYERWKKEFKGDDRHA